MLDLSHLNSYLGQGLIRWNLLYFGQHNIIYRYSINVPYVIVVYSSAYFVFVCRIYSQGRYGSYIYCSQQDAKDVLEIENTSPKLHLTQVCITKQQSTCKHSSISIYIYDPMIIFAAYTTQLGLLMCIVEILRHWTVIFMIVVLTSNIDSYSGYSAMAYLWFARMQATKTINHIVPVMLANLLTTCYS